MEKANVGQGEEPEMGVFRDPCSVLERRGWGTLTRPMQVLRDE